MSLTTTENSTAAEAPSFDSLGLSPTMLQALQEAAYSHPTPVQAAMIPRALTGGDVMAQARTGTGKTAAFVIPVLERLENRPGAARPQALILVPTRELAVQVRGEVVKLAAGRKVRSIAVYGGKPIRGQIDKLKKGCEVVVGTPGRVLDHMQRGTLDISDLRVVVLDEADRMLDIGFRPDIERILKKAPSDRQTLLLSATVPPAVERLAGRYMRDAEHMNLSPAEITVDTIDQYYFTVDSNRKTDLLLKLLDREQPAQAIVFCRTKRQTDRLYRTLKKADVAVDCIHGDLAQNARDRVMERFRGGKVKLLVATDVVGRGIDVSGISHIINYDIPAFCDDYVHRVGRTGRMGRQGVAYTFVTPEEGAELTRVEIRINRLLQRSDMPGFTTVATRPPPASNAAGPAGGSRGTAGGGRHGEAAASGEAAPASENGETKGDGASPAASTNRPRKRYRRAL